MRLGVCYFVLQAFQALDKINRQNNSTKPLLVAGAVNYKEIFMKLWCTEIKALEASTGEMKTWGGESVQAPTWELAQKWCDENKGYLKVVGELIAEIPCKEGTYEPDWDKMIDYENIQNN